jgi:mannose-6-phosphate isomerase class I
MKISLNEITEVDRISAKIKNFPFPVKNISVTNIKVDGRHPLDITKQHIEHKLTLICYVISGQGKFVVENKTHDVVGGDAILIKSDEKYFIEGNLEYLVCCEPAYYREQHEQV